MQGVFITGTGTGVGKTRIAVNIASQLTRHKINVIPRKPVESGCPRQGDRLLPQDAIALKQATNFEGELSEVCPYPFEPAVSPVRAARLVNRVLTTEQLATHCRQGNENDFMLIEGAGGFYSPLAEDGLNADLAVALQLPIILVADDRLGAINQVLLTTNAIQARGLPLLAVVLNAVADNTNDDMDNLADLHEHLDRPVYAIPFNRNGREQFPDELIGMLINSSRSIQP